MNRKSKYYPSFTTLVILISLATSACGQRGPRSVDNTTAVQPPVDPVSMGIEQFAQTVVFMMSPGADSQQMLGTGFVLYYTLPKHPNKFTWLVVTAKHVLATRPELAIRFNTVDGKPLTIRGPVADLVKLDDIWEHPDPGVDLAIIRLNVIPEVSVTAVQMSLIATPEELTRAQVKPLDRVILPNLLAPHYSKKNITILRDGSIASISDDRFDTPTGTGQQYIFVNSLVHGGMSGGPVFLRPDNDVSDQKQIVRKPPLLTWRD